MNFQIILSLIYGLFTVMAMVPWGESEALAAQRTQRLSLVGGTVIKGTDEPPITNAVVNIEDGRIVAVGPRSALSPLSGANILDASGKWILPGLIDAHIHFFQSGGLYTRPDIIDLRHVRDYQTEQSWIKQRLPFTFSRYLCSGITSVADVGGPLWTLDLNSPSHQPNHQPRPTISASGPLLSNYLPAEFQGLEDPSIIKLSSASTARSTVKDLAERGANFIKLWMIDIGNLSAMMPLFAAAIDEAHQRGLRVFAHATELHTAKMAVRAGVDVLVHAIEDRLLDAEILTLLKERGIITISTLAVSEGYNLVLSKTANVTTFMQQCGDPEVIETWAQIPSNFVIRPRRENPIPAQNIKRLVEEGLIVAAGSDAGNIGTLHGPGLHWELELLAKKAGLTPHQVLMTATQHAAKILSTSPDGGTVETGKKADLLIVRKDPRLDIRHLQEIDTVIQAGEVVNR